MAVKKTRKPKAVKPVEVATEVLPPEESQAKKDYRAWADRLKAENPMAYQKNESQITAKLNQLT